MKLYQELSTAINETMEEAEQTQEFKSRFAKLLENYFDNSYAENDISAIIDLVQLPEVSINGN